MFKVSILTDAAMQSLLPLADCFVSDELHGQSGAIPQADVLADD